METKRCMDATRARRGFCADKHSYPAIQPWIAVALSVAGVTCKTTAIFDQFVLTMDSAVPMWFHKVSRLIRRKTKGAGASQKPDRTLPSLSVTRRNVCQRFYRLNQYKHSV